MLQKKSCKIETKKFDIRARNDPTAQGNIRWLCPKCVFCQCKLNKLSTIYFQIFFNLKKTERDDQQESSTWYMYYSSHNTSRQCIDSARRLKKACVKSPTKVHIFSTYNLHFAPLYTNILLNWHSRVVEFLGESFLTIRET